MELQTQIDPKRWSRLYQSAMKYIKSTKHRYFQYRLLNKRLVTNVTRNIPCDAPITLDAPRDGGPIW